MSDYFYGLDGQQHGPASEAALLDMWSSGQISREAVVWKEGMSEWLPLWRVFPEYVPPPSPSSGGASAAASEATGAAPSAAPGSLIPCAFSGQLRPASEMIRFGDDHVAAEYRDRYLQRMMQGAQVGLPGAAVASVGQRFVGSLLDNLLMWFVVMVLGIPLGAVGKLGQSGVTVILTVLYLIASGIYEVSMLTTRGATLGKMAAGTKVANPSGENPSISQALIRWAVKDLPGGIPIVGIYYGIANVIATLVDQPKLRALHDRAASTLVVKSR